MNKEKQIEFGLLEIHINRNRDSLGLVWSY